MRKTKRKIKRSVVVDKNDTVELPKEYDSGRTDNEIDKEYYDKEKRVWKKRPKILPCPFGPNPVWNEKGENFQKQLLCVVHGVFINPNGFTCKTCKRGKFPRHKWVETRIKEYLKKETTREALLLAEKRLLSAVKEGEITEEQAFEIIEETGLDEALEKNKSEE